MQWAAQRGDQLKHVMMKMHWTAQRGSVERCAEKGAMHCSEGGSAEVWADEDAIDRSNEGSAKKCSTRGSGWGLLDSSGKENERDSDWLFSTFQRGSLIEACEELRSDTIMALSQSLSSTSTVSSLYEKKLILILISDQGKNKLLSFKCFDSVKNFVPEPIQHTVIYL